MNEKKKTSNHYRLMIKQKEANTYGQLVKDVLQSGQIINGKFHVVIELEAFQLLNTFCAKSPVLAEAFRNSGDTTD